VSRRRLRTLAIGACATAALATAGARAEPALVEVGNLILHADGSFQPRTLPKRHFAPTDFRGRVEIAAKDGGRPSPLQQVVVDFDRDGRLTPGPLPACAPETIANATTEEARQLCRGAALGTGRIRASVALPGGPVESDSALSLFNGPTQQGNPTVVMHAQLTVPATQTYAIVVPIERRSGPFRYRATLQLPPLAEGLASITHLDVDVGRRFKVGGERRSYTAARCPDSILETRGRFSFADGTVIDGSVEKFCRAR